MNIKDTIRELGLENENLPRILTQRVNTVLALREKIEVAKTEVEDDPSEENQESLQEIKDYYAEYFEDVKSQLKAFRKKLDAKNNGDEVHTAEVVDDKDKKGGGFGALLIGGVLLVATLGAVNIMRNK